MTRKGKWILECDGENECDNLYKCSMCGFECGCEEYDKPNFCPNCGTDMRIEDRVKMTKEKAIQMLKLYEVNEAGEGELETWYNGIDKDMREALDIAIKALSESHWIPISEGLPNDQEIVNVTVVDDHGDNEWRYTTTAWRSYDMWISDNELVMGTVVAWAPLPKPYKGDRL